jgi:transcription elongation GreA/GreB family factor
MSKAFTREDADASFDTPARGDRPGHAVGSHARLTAYGARIARERLAELERGGPPAEGALAVERLRELVEGAVVVDPAGADHVALGARVRVRAEDGKERVVVLVTPDEVGLVPSAISAASPIAQALLGASVGETVELELPRGTEELTVLALEWPR